MEWMAGVGVVMGMEAAGMGAVAGMQTVAAEKPVVGPVSLAERIEFIDVLRGMALFGILAANMRAFNGPLDAYGDTGVLFHSAKDLWAQGFVQAFIQGKFISIFSFLFGMGFAIQMSRAEARGVKFLSFYPRRLLALALFGVIHGALIWAGDVLLTYACSGAILLLFRKRQQKTLLWWAGGLMSLPIVVSSVFFTIFHTRWHRAWMDPKAPDVAKFYKVIAIYAHGTARQIIAQNWVEWKQELPITLFAIYAAALFLLGMWVWRAGIVQRLDEYKPVLKKVCGWCLAIGLPLNIYIAVMFAISPRTSVTVWFWLANILWLPASHTLAAGYASGIALLYLNPDWRKRVMPFAAVGRTALTNYLAQSVICTLFFYHYITGWYGRIGPALGLVPTVVLFAAQVGISNWWLGRYRFGPMEWLWRGMTYGKFPSMKREDVAGAVAVGMG
jgi:uncharacterized protein